MTKKDDYLEMISRTLSVSGIRASQSLEDRKFAHIDGAQWDGNLAEQFTDKPKFSYNRINLALTDVSIEFRQSPISVRFSPKYGYDADKVDDFADICTDLFRGMMSTTESKLATSNAFDEAVAGGFGAFRLTTKYLEEEDEQDEHQEIICEPIYNADQTVFFDPYAKLQSKKDARFCFVIHQMSPEEYEEQFGEWKGELPSLPIYMNMCGLYGGLFFDNLDKPEYRRIAEFYIKEEQKTNLHYYAFGNDTTIKYYEDQLTPELKASLKERGFTFQKKREVKRTRIRKLFIGGDGVREDCGYIAGSHLPIIPVYGKRAFIDGVEYCYGEVRWAKDAVKIFNINLSYLVSIASASPATIPVFLKEQVNDPDVWRQWSERHIKIPSFLTINPIYDANGQPIISQPVTMLPPPDIPPAVNQLLTVGSAMLDQLLSTKNLNADPSQQVSGVAIQNIMNRADQSNSIYLSNMGVALEYAGDVWLSMAKDVYTEEGRVMRTLTADGNTKKAKINIPAFDEEGKAVMKNSFSNASYEVRVDTESSSRSARESVIRNVLLVLQYVQDPEVQRILTFTIMRNIQGEGMQDIRRYFRQKLVELGISKPNQEERAMLEEMAVKAQEEAQNDPTRLYIEAEAKKSEAQAQKTMAEVQKIQAEIEKMTAEMQMLPVQIAKILSEVDKNQAQADNLDKQLTNPKE